MGWWGDINVSLKNISSINIYLQKGHHISVYLSSVAL